MSGRLWRIRLITLATLVASVHCFAAPSRLVIVRHSEKLDKWNLCQTGWERADALTEQYLGMNARTPLFESEPPAAIFTMTLHTSQTAQPIAHSLGLPLTNYVVLPGASAPKEVLDAEANRQNRLAVGDLLNNPRYKGQQVLMVWEHFHIASSALESKYPGEQITLRQLFKLDQPPFAKVVPATWPDSNYNFFWVIDFNADGSVKAFKTLRQAYQGRYANLPDNDWAASESLPNDSSCLRD